MSGPSPDLLHVTATVVFAFAVLHTFSTAAFQRLAHIAPSHSGLWHLLGEVEVVFGFWALVLLLFIAGHSTPKSAIQYLETRNFTEPAFVFVIMVIAASRPILELSRHVLYLIAQALPLRESVAFYFVALAIGPLLGSFITEPAAMTLTALLLRDRFLTKPAPATFKYATVGVLFVNVSIGGVLTPFAAPPVLMVAATWGWDIGFMMTTFGWRAVLAVLVNAAAVTMLFARQLALLGDRPSIAAANRIPPLVTAVHVVFLLGVIVTNHHPLVFGGLFLFFLGFVEAYERYQSRLILREGLLVAFFLSGLVILGGLQTWWLQPLLNSVEPTALFFGATLLTAITDNAALTYLGSLLQGVGDDFKYALVSGAVTGGGLTVIANAPNPAGYSILKGTFESGMIDHGRLLAAAALPTLVAMLAFWGIPG